MCVRAGMLRNITGEVGSNIAATPGGTCIGLAHSVGAQLVISAVENNEKKRGETRRKEGGQRPTTRNGEEGNGEGIGQAVGV